MRVFNRNNYYKYCSQENKMDDLENLVGFFITTNKLKETTRYSSCPLWIQESTPDHSWYVTFMAPIVAKQFELKIDLLHAMEIAVVHDLMEYNRKNDFEAYLVSKGTLNKKDKEESEEAAISYLRKNFLWGDKLYPLVKEYNEGKTEVARYIIALGRCADNIHVMERGGFIPGEDPKFQICYADKAVENFPPLKPFLRAIKKKMRYLFELNDFEWKHEYNYPD